jgi:hypothetical protein
MNMKSKKALAFIVTLVLAVQLIIPVKSFAFTGALKSDVWPSSSVAALSASVSTEGEFDSSYKIFFHDDSNTKASGLYLQKGVWGEARDIDVLAVLQSVADVYAETYGNEYISRLDLHTVITKSLYEYPMLLSDLSAIWLSASNRSWARYMFQFSHELYHYIGDDGDADDRHQWFEEAIAAMHSLYVLDILAEEWETDAPYDNWIDYAPAIRDYYDNLLNDNDYGIYGFELAQYYKANRESLEENPYYIIKDDRRAVDALAPILYSDVFKDNTEAWEALTVLHTMEDCNDYTFEDYINEWYDKCSEGQKSVVMEVAYILDIDLQ